MVESPPVDTLVVALGEDGWLLGLHEGRHAGIGRDLRVLAHTSSTVQIHNKGVRDFMS